MPRALATSAFQVPQTEPSHARLSSRSAGDMSLRVNISTADLYWPTRNTFQSTDELVERVLDEDAVVREAVDVGDALRVEVDLVGVRGEVVLRLVEVLAEGDDRLAAGAETIDGSGDFLQLGGAAAVEAAEVEVQRADAVVVAGGIDRIDDVAQQRFGRRLAQGLGDRALERVAGELLDQRALRRDDERRLVRDERDRPGEERADDREDQQQQQQVQDLAQAVEAQPRSSAGSCGWHASGALVRRQTFSSIRADLPVRSRRKYSLARRTLPRRFTVIAPSAGLYVWNTRSTPRRARSCAR